ncbi:MAG TPA: hypothetical protein VK964_00640 [Nocardioidaceae bacterium]|jgi:ketosteroid isomerase-like protein|nr:hypothetical protein [Nocardioidaceae bacterium]
MGAKQNLELVEELQQAARDRAFDRYGELLAADAVFRIAGVPARMGGVVTADRRSSTSSDERPTTAASRSRRCSATTRTYASWAR